MTKERRTTISDIANKSGYSKTAVSFAFNAPNRISAQAVKRILEVAKELNYSPDPLARNLSLGRHRAIGLLLPQSASSSLRNSHTQDIVRGAAEVAEKEGYLLTLIPPLNASIPEAVRNATVDGLITLGLVIDSEIHQALETRKLPVVSIDGADGDSIPTVSIDNEAAAKLQLEQVLKAGHRRIAIVSLPATAFRTGPSGTAESRLKGYSEALEEYGLSLDEMTVITTPSTFEDGKEALTEILPSAPTCIVAMSDEVAHGLMAAAHENGLSIPRDFSVVGFDGIDPAWTAALATVVQDGAEKGRKAAETLFSLLDGRPYENKISIPFSFRQADSLRCL